MVIGLHPTLALTFDGGLMKKHEIASEAARLIIAIIYLFMLAILA